MMQDQYIASDPATSVWVSASAGTGKTKVLTDRVLRLLLGGALPGKILCITYTKAAAAEMEGRIKAQLAEWVIASEEALRAQLLALTGKTPAPKILRRARQLFSAVLDAPQAMRIQTIHSFCQSVLMRFPLEAGLPPHFSLIDEQTAEELRNEARLRLFSGAEENSGCSEAIGALAALLSEASFTDLIKEIIENRRKFIPLLANNSVEALQEKIRDALSIAPCDTEVSLAKSHFHYSQQDEQNLKHASELLGRSSAKTDKELSAALGIWLAGHKDPEKYASAYLTRDAEPRKRLHTRESAKDWPALTQVLLAEQSLVCAYMEGLRAFRVATASCHVVTLAASLLTLYRHLKALRGALDYDDLILHTVELLHRPGVAPWVLYKLDDGIDHLLVDEAQDTSPEQWKLVDALANEFFAGEAAHDYPRTVFIVGDEKQSIFSFQGADPLAFDATRQRMVRQVAAKPASFKRVELSLSFRSTAPVLAAVDAVFALPEARDGLLFAEQDISHSVHRKGAAGHVEFWPLIATTEEDDTAAWPSEKKARYQPRPEQLCAKEIAATIGKWLKEKRMLASHGRAITPGDIMILVQRRGLFSDAMLSALKRAGIPVAGADRLVLTEHIAVQDCMALAEFLLLPQDDLTLATVLKSPFIGLSEEALFELAYERGHQSLWQSLRGNKTYSAAADFLFDLLAKTDYHTPYALFTYVLEVCGGRKKLAARLGHEIFDPLDEFLSLALKFEAAHPPSLQGFMHWLAQGATEIKRDMEKGSGEVRILTVHGAKGLQAPIVLLPDTTRSPQYDSGILWTQTGLPLWSPFSAYDDTHYSAIKQRRREEANREYRRLLYVAMTRAEDELYICGWQGSKSISGGCWYELIRKAIAARSEWSQTEGKLVLSSPQTATIKSKPSITTAVHTPTLAPWAGRVAADEPASPKPLAASHMESRGRAFSPLKNLAARERGTLIHRLLQYLPETAVSDRSKITARFLKRYAKNFDEQERIAIKNQVNAILVHPEFAPVFATGSLAEAPITGLVHDKAGQPIVISGRIDRLRVSEKEVYIIDYKSNRDVPKNISKIPRNYVRQMEAYRALMKKIYPNKTIYCAILWTTEPTLMILPEGEIAAIAS